METTVLHLTPAGLAAYRRTAGCLTEIARFDDDPAGREGFARYLAGHCDGTFRILADVAGEVLREEAIPTLGGRDRRALIGRRIAQSFAETGLATAIGSDRRSGARDETVVLAGLVEPLPIAAWLGILADAGAALAGLNTPTQLVPGILSDLGLGRGRCVVATFHAAGLRQTWIDAGLPRLARLTAVADHRPETLAATFVTESLRLLDYLGSQRTMVGDDAPPIRVLAPAPLAALLVAAASGEPRLRVEPADLDALAARYRLPPPADGRADPVFVDRLLRAPPRAQFAPGPALRAFRLRRRHRAARRLAVGLFVAGGLLAATTEVEIGRLRGEIDRIGDERRALADRTYALAAAVPAFPGEVELAGRRLRALSNRDARPDDLFRTIAAGLDRHPALALKAVDWEVRDDGAEAVTVEVEPDAGPAALAPADLAAFAADLRDMTTGSATLIRGPVAGADRRATVSVVGKARR